MAIDNNEIKKTITVDVGGAVTSLKEYKQHIDDLRGALLQLDESSEEYQQIAQEIANEQNKLNSVMKVGKSTVDAAEGSYNALTKTMSELKKQWRATTDEAERTEIGRKILDINNQLKELDASTGNFQRSVGDYSNAFEKAFDKCLDGIKTIDGPVGELGGRLKNLLPVIKAINTTATSGLKGIKAGIASTGIGLLVVAVGELAAHWDEVSTAIKTVMHNLGLVKDDMADTFRLSKIEIQEVNTALTDFEYRLRQIQGETELQLLKEQFNDVQQAIHANNEELARLYRSRTPGGSSTDPIEQKIKELQDANGKLMEESRNVSQQITILEEKERKAVQERVEAYVKATKTKYELLDEQYTKDVADINRTVKNEEQKNDLLAKAYKHYYDTKKQYRIEDAKAESQTYDQISTKSQEFVDNLNSTIDQINSKLKDFMPLSGISDEQNLYSLPTEAEEIDRWIEKLQGYLEYINLVDDEAKAALDDQYKNINLREETVEEYITQLMGLRSAVIAFIKNPDYQAELDRQWKLYADQAKDAIKKIDNDTEDARTKISFMPSLDEEKHTVDEIYQYEKQILDDLYTLDTKQSNARIAAYEQMLDIFVGTELTKEELLQKRQELEQKIVVLEEQMDKYPDNEQLTDQSLALEAELAQIDILLEHYDYAARHRQEIDQEIEETRRQQAAKTAEYETALNELSVKRIKEKQKAVISSITASSNVMSGLFDNMSELSKEGSKQAKAFAIMSATINAFGSAVGAYKSASEIPYVGWIMAPIAAASALAAGMVQVQNIRNQNVDNGGSTSTSSSASVASPSVSIQSAMAEVSPLLDEQNDINRMTSISEPTQSQQNREQNIRVYVVDQDIRDANHRAEVVESNSTF